VAGGYVQTGPPSGPAGYSAIVATDSGGHWHRFATLTLPTDAVAGNPTAQVTSISCPAKAFCVAVGYYTGTIPDNTAVHGFMASYRNGTWSPAVTVPLPGGESGPSALYSVSCASSSHCVAVGALGSNELPAGGSPFSVTYSQGSWQPSAKPALPARMSSDGMISMAVSCHADGGCIAVGSAYNYSSGTVTSLQWGQSAGRWRLPTITKPPAAADPKLAVSLVAVSCSAAEACVSVGFFTHRSSDTALQVVRAGGRWRRGLWIRYDSATLSAVDCTSWHCVAVGQYDALYGSLVMSERHGEELGDPVRVRLPSTAVSNKDNEQVNGFTAVSCLGRTWCTAVGYYTGPQLRPVAMVSAN
jgi:hypothetical protein